MAKTYEIIKLKDGNEAIKCKKCGMISHHPKDIEHKYCDKCKMFHQG